MGKSGSRAGFNYYLVVSILIYLVIPIVVVIAVLKCIIIYDNCLFEILDFRFSRSFQVQY